MKTQEKLIYIVEDSKIIAEILNKVISSIPDTKAKDFSNGESMLAALLNETPDMIFLDFYLYDDSRTLNMDKTIMNGEDIFNEIQKTHPDLPVVLLTGMSDSNKIEEMKAKGICCVVHKEVDDIFTSVVACVDKYVLNKSFSK